MRSRRHVGKNQNERRLLTQKIQKANYEPTLDTETMEFQGSDEILPFEAEEERAHQTNQVRNPGTIATLKDKLTENITVVFITIMSGILLFFLTTVFQSIGRLEGKLEEIRGSIQETKSDVKKILEDFNSQDDTVKKSEWNITNIRNDIKDLEKETENLKKKVDDLRNLPVSNSERRNE